KRMFAYSQNISAKLPRQRVINMICYECKKHVFKGSNEYKWGLYVSSRWFCKQSCAWAYEKKQTQKRALQLKEAEIRRKQQTLPW
ncbi:hypothetical protein MUP77_07765, partial [Candidatus Bathyarchaeota archaeon]|nr:hypothetical protein [Candidatus Bathyarchaeota archaeon]